MGLHINIGKIKLFKNSDDDGIRNIFGICGLENKFSYLGRMITYENGRVVVDIEAWHK